ncbi:unnamed protein product, partial [Heterotrigona itama]
MFLLAGMQSDPTMQLFCSLVSFELEHLSNKAKETLSLGDTVVIATLVTIGVY